MPEGFLGSRPLGASGIEVSALSLGSWRTFERLPADTGVAVMRAAREEGINFFDDARYDDETGTAPIRTGYSEVVFGELFRGAGIRRDGAVVANKLWWEFWPGQSAAAELDASLQRMGFSLPGGRSGAPAHARCGCGTSTSRSHRREYRTGLRPACPTPVRADAGRHCRGLD